jgi:hypothetical protein
MVRGMVSTARKAVMQMEEQGNNEEVNEAPEPEQLPPDADRITGAAPPTRDDPQSPVSQDAPRWWWEFWKTGTRP